ncbi:MAG: cytochrome P450 [Acidimicrobiia bacterium]
MSYDPITTLFDPSTADNPAEAYRRLREECPVARTAGPFGDAVVISRYEDVLWALKHPEVFSSSAALEIGQEQPLIPLQIDPPEHAKYRRLLDPEFSPKRMAEIEPDARALVNRIIDRFADRGDCDFHEEFATPLPSTVFLRLMGLPQSDLPLFLQWRDNTIRPDVAPGDLEAAARIREETGHAITAYFEEAIAERRKRPDDGLLSRLVRAQIDGRPLDQRELLGICHLLLLGGLDTVTATLDCSIAYLATHPQQRRRLVEDPSRTAAAVEELLRAESPVMMVVRSVKEDTVFGGVELHKGDSVTLLLGAADRDPAEFPDPDTVDFDRTQNRHLAFGGGPHRCLGSHLARMELRVGLEEFHRRIPEYRIADGAELHFSPGIRQVASLPLVFPVR